VPLLAHLDDGAIGRLADALQHVHVAAGDTVVAEGDQSSGRCFFVEGGALQVLRGGADEGQLLPGDVYGEDTLDLDVSLQPASVVALEDCRLLLMDRATALRLAVFSARG
jgi:CRP-like cAMP-binding protein